MPLRPVRNEDMRSVILACSTLRKAVQCARELSKTNYPVHEPDRTYHENPAKMRRHILDTLAALATASLTH